MTATTHAALPASMLTSAEQRSAARQLTLAMLALGLLALGLVWRWLAPVSYTHLTLPTKA